jgi:hypothetical protein
MEKAARRPSPDEYDSKAISDLYTDFAKQTFKPFEGLIAKMTPAK